MGWIERNFSFKVRNLKNLPNPTLDRLRSRPDWLQDVMSFKLPLDAPQGKSLRRVGVKQLAQALRQLTPHDGKQPDVHQARKCFKRFRSLLLLAKPGMERGAFERYNTGMRDIARCFASARDRQAMLETIAKIEADATEAAVLNMANALKTALGQNPESAPATNEKAQRQALGRLAALRRAFRSDCIDIQKFDGLRGGLIAVYERGRAQMEALRGTHDITDEAFHEWRKSVQRHWRHLQLLSASWPEMMREQIKLARSLSQILGDDHDLSVLRNFALRHRSLGTKAEVAAFASFCSQRQLMLRSAADVHGRRLFADKPKSLAKRLAAYWETGRATHAAGSMPARTTSAPHILTLVK